MQGLKPISPLEREIFEEEARIRDLRKTLGEKRLKLPLTEVENQVFACGRSGAEVSLKDLFQGHSDLILVHNMGAQCPGCTLWADELNGAYEHLWSRTAFAVVSNDDWKSQSALIKKRGWRFPLVSAKGTSYSAQAGFQAEDEGHGIYRPGVSTYTKRADGKIFRAQRSAFGPGDEYNGAWNLISLLDGGGKGWFSKIAYPDAKHDACAAAL